MTSFTYKNTGIPPHMTSVELDGSPLSNCSSVCISHTVGGLVKVELVLELSPSNVSIEVYGQKDESIITVFPGLADLAPAQLRQLEAACRLLREGS